MLHSISYWLCILLHCISGYREFCGRDIIENSCTISGWALLYQSLAVQKMDTQCKFMAHLQAAGREGGRAGGETEMGGEGAAEDHEECKG